MIFLEDFDPLKLPVELKEGNWCKGQANPGTYGFISMPSTSIDVSFLEI
jgi:hypothetical protein